MIERNKALLELQNLGPAHPKYLNVMKEAEASCRPLIAAALGADESEVALTQSTTAGINVVLWSIDWRAGDEIIISDEEHPALLVPVYNLRDRLGVVARVVSMTLAEDLVVGVVAKLTSRTRLVAMSHVSRQSGTVVPARALTAALRPHEVPLLLDGAQGPGNVPVNFHEIGCDYYSLCGHKWLLGPKGTGALLIRRDRLDRTPVSWTGAQRGDGARGGPQLDGTLGQPADFLVSPHREFRPAHAGRDIESGEERDAGDGPPVASLAGCAARNA